MKLFSRLFALGAFSAVVVATGCSSALSQPFQTLQNNPIVIFKLQNYEVPVAAPGAPVNPAAALIPPQLQTILQQGAAMLPPGLIPPGILPGSVAPAAAADAPRFHGFRILGSMTITDAKQRAEILDIMGHGSNFSTPRQSCMYPEFGIMFGQGSAMGAPVAAPSSTPPADVLISVACDQVQMFNYGWPYGGNIGLGPDTSKRVIAVAQKAFGG